jgi:DNA-binding GntR family transcriptional regulator
VRDPEYIAIAKSLRDELLAGNYDDAGVLPGNAELAERFSVNLKTAGRAVQQLVAQKLLIARPGMKPLVVPPDRRATPWPMTGRYAKARSNDGLLFAGEVAGTLKKVTMGREWQSAPVGIAGFLQVAPTERVFRRESHTYVNDQLCEVTSMFFPHQIIERVPRLESDPEIRVVALLEDSGYEIARTVNEVRAREADLRERELFGLAEGDSVFEQTHGTYGFDGEPLEAVINIRPTHGNVLTFETNERPESS